MTKALLILALLLGACASPPATFTAEPGLEEATRAAVATWEAALPCAMHVGYVTHDADVIVEWKVVPDKANGAHTYGEGGVEHSEIEVNAWVYIDPEVPVDAIATVVAHEMGHALRAPHSTYEGDLMFPHYTAGMVPQATARDGKAACDAWGM